MVRSRDQGDPEDWGQEVRKASGGPGMLRKQYREVLSWVGRLLELRGGPRP